MPTKRHELATLKKYFIKNKRAVIKSPSFSLLFFIIAIAITGLKAFYPYHFLISIVFLFLCFRFLIKATLFNKKKVLQSKTFLITRQFFGKHKILTILVILGCFIAYALWTVIPHEGNPFNGMTNQARKEMVEADLEIATVLMDNLQLAGDDLINSHLLTKGPLNAEEAQILKEKWNLFLSVAIESEKTTDIHKYFMRINIFTSPLVHAESFMISYSLYIKKFELFHRLIDRVSDNETVIKQLNEYSPVFGSKNSYDDVLSRFFSSDSLVRRSLGRIYLSFLSLILPEAKLHEGYLSLESESIKSHSYLLNNVFFTGANAIKEKKYRLEKNLSTIWFPVQKNVANIMGESYVSTRHDKFITIPQIVEMKKSLQPGDIMIQRRNWYASNVGIPGFWAHAALYTGNIEDLHGYFDELFPMDGYANLDELLDKKYPAVAKKLRQRDANDHAFAVIEGKAPGIILQSLEESAHADYLAALRPRLLSKQDKFAAILRAFGNYGKPYDYEFDFETLDEIVCSELVYDAYQPLTGKLGLHFELTLTSGRKMILPNGMIKKFHDENGSPDREFDFVYFLDGNEELGKAFVKDANALLKTWQRPKYSWFQD